MPSFEVTVQCSKCNCSDLYDDVDFRVEVGDEWSDPCTDCGAEHGNEVISVEASDD